LGAVGSSTGNEVVVKQEPSRRVGSGDFAKGLAEKTVQLAVAISPAGVREIRREQWQADLLGADETGLSARRLALGTLSTAALHRLRSTPGAKMPSVIPRESRVTAGLFAISALSLIVGLVSQRTVFYVWTSLTQHRVGMLVQLVFVFIVPLTMFLIAFLRVRASASRRAVAVALFCTGSLAFLVGHATTGPIMLLASAMAAALFLATWAVVQRSEPMTWLLLIAPYLAIVSISFAGVAALSVFDSPSIMRSDVYEAARLVLALSPIVTALVCALVMRPRLRRPVGAVGTAS
jgi:hypothetical protein